MNPELFGALSNVIANITIGQAMMICIIIVGALMMTMIFILFRKVKKLEKNIANNMRCQKDDKGSLKNERLY